MSVQDEFYKIVMQHPTIDVTGSGATVLEAILDENINELLLNDANRKPIPDPDADGLRNLANLAYWQSIINMQFAFKSNTTSSDETAEQRRIRSVRIRKAKQASLKKRTEKYRPVVTKENERHTS